MGGKTNPVWEQTGYRFRNDDGSETGATWKAALNTPLPTELADDTTFRLRVQVSETAGASTTPTFVGKLQYRLNGGTWTDVAISLTAVQFTASADTSWTISDGDPTTEQLAGSQTFLAGTMEEDASWGSQTDVSAEDIEIEAVLTIDSSLTSHGDCIELQVVHGNGSDAAEGTELVYTQPIAAITVDAGVTVSSPTLTELTFGTSATDATSVTTASVSPSANALVLAVIDSSYDTTVPTLPTASGGGMTTWTLVRSFGWDDSGSTRRLTIFRALQASPGSGTITFDFSGETQLSFRWWVGEYSPVLTGLNGANAVVQNVQDPAAPGSEFGFRAFLAAFADNNNATFAVGSKADSVDGDMAGDPLMTTVRNQADGDADARMLVMKKDGREGGVEISWETVIRRGCVFALEVAKGTAAPTSKAMVSLLAALE